MFGRFAYRIGDRVVFTVAKRSTSPGRRAKDVWPERAGDGYRYHVVKFWIVREVREKELVLQTRRGKLHIVPINDPCLRKAGLWAKLHYGRRFPLLAPPSPTPAV